MGISMGAASTGSTLAPQPHAYMAGSPSLAGALLPASSMQVRRRPCGSATSAAAVCRCCRAGLPHLNGLALAVAQLLRDLLAHARRVLQRPLPRLLHRALHALLGHCNLSAHVHLRRQAHHAASNRAHPLITRPRGAWSTLRTVVQAKHMPSTPTGKVPKVASGMHPWRHKGMTRGVLQ